MTTLRVRLSLDLSYAQAARRAQYLLRLEPHGAEAVSLSIEPFSHTQDRRLDRRGFGACYVALDAPHDRVMFSAEAEVQPAAPLSPPELAWEDIRREIGTPASPEALEAAACLAPVGDGGAGERLFRPGETLRQGVGRLPRGVTPALAALRAAGLAAVAVSGIAFPDGAGPEHRYWLAIFAGQGRWCEWDSERGLSPGPRLRLGLGRSLEDVAPVRAVAVGAGDMTATFRVARA